ncbi:hypothetical protein JK364_22990 [Streptomyces sp. 110]|uniref:DUF8094 domain-containing protein n=1 Tax=Streptomyces endocoffeicus TaxID=2898945 RepID=A0ABS1PU35_9ACTN|nr:hypothetical protein [Streptomyces endocoffeicus]MBL1115241.1 hypothetical protein [Streptomyces endocoffeicus]
MTEIFSRHFALRTLSLVAMTGMLISCTSSSHQLPHGTATSPSSGDAAPTGIVTLRQAAKILDRYQRVNNAANAARDASLLATVEAGQLYAESKAELEQYYTFSKKRKKEYRAPFFFTKRTFYIPARGNWFAASANSGKYRTLMVFERFGSRWKKVVDLLPDRRLPLPHIKDGLALTAPTDEPSGALSPDRVPGAIEDLFTTGGKKEGTNLSVTPDSKAIVKTYQERNSELGDQARVNFFPATPRHQTVYALRTGTGVLAIVPLAHKQVSVVKHAGLQLTPTEAESAYASRPRPQIVSEFQGNALVNFPAHSRPEILNYEYGLVDSR